MLAKFRLWIVRKVILWAEYEDVVVKSHGVPVSELPKNSDGSVNKDSIYWSSVASVRLNKPFMHEVELFIKAKELWVRDAAYASESPEEMARRDAFFRGSRSFVTMIDRANAKYQELTRGSNG